MTAMPIRKFARTTISLIAALALLFCQAAWAGMRAPERLAAAAGPASAAAAASSCHDLGTGDVPDNAAPSPCDSAQVASESHTPAVLAPVALGPVAFRAETAGEPRQFRFDRTQRSGAPPPVRLLLCKLLH